MKKRGLSTVVTTLIIILLVLVAVGIIWVVIANVVTQGSEQITLDKFTTSLKIKDVKVDENTSSFNVDVKRNVGKGDLEGIKFIFNDGVNSEIYDEDNVNLEELGERRFNFILNSLDASYVQTVSIAPIFKSGSGKKIYGGIIATYMIKGTGILGSCVANCTGKVCGVDGCGGICGTCNTGEYCSTDQTQCIVGVNPCSLTSASWSTTNVVEGTNVILNSAGTTCSGTALNYSIYEADVGADTFITSSTVSSLSTNWIAQWMDDGVGQGDPEYYFTVTVVDNPSEQVTSNNQLTVTPITGQTCAQLGGTICTGAQTCSGTILNASDSNSCCSVACTNPPVTTGVHRSFSSSTVAPNGQIDVTLQVIVGGATYYAIEEYVPLGWTVINDGGGLTNDPQVLKWAVISSAVDTSYTYTVQAPASTGNYNFDGIYQLEGMSASATTLDSTTVTVA